MLKNKIIKILRKYSDFDEDDHKESQEFNSMTGDFEKLINLEVEKRIAERMPSEEEIDDETIAWAAEHQCGTPFSERWIGFVKGAKWLRSRLTNPGDSQKTEGGENG